MNRLEDIILKNSGPIAPIAADTAAQLNKLEGVKSRPFRYLWNADHFRVGGCRHRHRT